MGASLEAVFGGLLLCAAGVCGAFDLIAHVWVANPTHATINGYLRGSTVLTFVARAMRESCVLTSQGGGSGRRWRKAFEPAESLWASMSGQIVAGHWCCVEAWRSIARAMRRLRAHPGAQIL